jgi:hypothetical protein
MPYTLAAAAAATGLSKTTIFRAIKSGKISGSKDVNGQWEVEPAELHRVYPPFAEATESTDAAQHDAIVHATAAAEVELKLALLEERVIYLKDALDEMRGQRNAWQTQAERLALTDERPQRSWWKRLAG